MKKRGLERKKGRKRKELDGKEGKEKEEKSREGKGRAGKGVKDLSTENAVLWLLLQAFRKES